MSFVQWIMSDRRNSSPTVINTNPIFLLEWQSKNIMPIIKRVVFKIEDDIC